MTARLADIAVAIVAAAMTASVAVALAGLADPASAPAARAATNVANLSPDLSVVTRLAPFGRVVPADARGLDLRGVMLATPGAASIALIAAAGGKALPYAAGDTLPGGAVLDSVEFDLVLLRVDGAVVTLGFPAARPAAVPVAGVRSAPSVLPDRETLAGLFGASSTADGYRVGAGLPPTLRAAGLVPGDRIETVDGSRVGDPARDREVLDRAVVNGRARVGVVRDGRHLTIDAVLG